jgi:iron complex transport system substrate-binding protein
LVSKTGAAQRIVSLLPSATEIVCALGLGERLVGISHSCDYPAAVLAKPRLSRPHVGFEGLSSAEIDATVRRSLRDHGSVYDIDVPGVAALAPDLVLTQGICDVCAVPEHQAVAALAGLPLAPDVLTLDAHDLSAILAGIRSVGRAAGVEQRADACVAGIEDRLATVRARVAGRPRPRVLALEWLDPPYVPGHWVPEMITIAGGDLIVGVARRPSSRVTWEALRAGDPDVLLVMPCGFGLEETVRASGRYREALEGVAGRAIAAGHAYALDASAYFSRSGPRVADGVEILGALLHPEQLPAVSVVGWAAILPGR